MVEPFTPSAATPTRTYELLLQIGTGGMGTVHLGRVMGMGGFTRYVAVKCCHPHLTADQQFKDMFLNEAKLAARIHHPNVVPTLDVGEADVLYLVMEYVEGERLSAFIQADRARGEWTPVDVTLRIVLDALAGVHAAHVLTDSEGASLEVIHRDATPQNIMVGVDGVSRILDFGIAKAASQASTTREGHVRGKLGYIPPEQLANSKATRQTDVFSLGVVLWETLTGERLFKGDTDADTATLVMRGKVPPVSSLRGDVPPALDEVIRKATHRDATKRYATALAFSEALEGLNLPVASARTVGAYAESVFGEALKLRRGDIRAAERGDGTRRILGGAANVPTETGMVRPSIKHWPFALAGAAAVILVAVALILTRGGETPAPPRPTAPPNAVAAQTKAEPVVPTLAAVPAVPEVPDAGLDAGTAGTATPARNAIGLRPPRDKQPKRKKGEWWPDAL